jgi:hypothetical protein
MLILTGIHLFLTPDKPQASWKRSVSIFPFCIAVWSLIVTFEAWRVYREVSNAVPYGVGPGLAQDVTTIQVQGLCISIVTVLLLIIEILNIRRFQRIRLKNYKM